MGRQSRFFRYKGYKTWSQMVTSACSNKSLAVCLNKKKTLTATLRPEMGKFANVGKSGANEHEWKILLLNCLQFLCFFFVWNGIMQICWGSCFFFSLLSNDKRLNSDHVQVCYQNVMWTQNKKTKFMWELFVFYMYIFYRKWCQATLFSHMVNFLPFSLVFCHLQFYWNSLFFVFRLALCCLCPKVVLNFPLTKTKYLQANHPLNCEQHTLGVWSFHFTPIIMIIMVRSF